MSLPRSAAGGHGYTLLLECAQLLLALGSSALYSPSARGQLGQHPFLDAMMQQRDLANPSECANCFVDQLIYWRTHVDRNVFCMQQHVPTDSTSHLPICRSRASAAALLHRRPCGTAQREDCALHANRYTLSPQNRAHGGG